MSAHVARDAMRARVDTLERELHSLQAFFESTPEVAELTGDGPHDTAAEDLLLCRAGGRCVAVALDCVSEVLPAARLMELPDAEPSVLGALNLRGTSLVVHDLARRLNGEHAALARTDLILACTVAGRRVGLKITDAIDVVRAKVTPMAGQTGAVPGSTLLRGAIVHDGQQVVVIEAAAFAGCGLRGGGAQ